MGEAEVEVRAQGEWLQGRQGRSRGVRMRGSYLQLRMRGSYLKLALCPDSAAAQRRSIFTLTPPPLPQADLALALPPWTYQYRRGLSSDNSRAVRAEAAALTGELVAAAGRMAAPHLKQLAGPWWVWGRGEEGKWSRVRVHALLGSW